MVLRAPCARPTINMIHPALKHRDGLIACLILDDEPVRWRTHELADGGGLRTEVGAEPVEIEDQH
jgi:hypothetical protein